MKRPVIVGLVLVAVGVAVATMSVIWSDGRTPEDSLGRFDVPEIGATDPGELTNGQPVFVSTDLDGVVAVVATVSTHLPGDPMAWCPKSRTIDDVPHGGRFDVQGRYVSGPASTDLGTYAVEISESGTTLVVVSFVQPSGRSISPDPPITAWCVDGGYEFHPQYIDD